MLEYIKGIFCFTTFVSWAYTTTALIACQSADLPYPDWFYPAATVAVVTFLILVWVCVHDILTNEMPRYSTRRIRRRNARCLGVIRFVDGSWMAVRENEEGEED